MSSVAILNTGMVTGIGFTTGASCAAIRCGIDNFSETRFMDRGGEWIIGSQVTFDQPWGGLRKLVNMLVPAIQECLAEAGGVRPETIPLFLCVAEKGRAGRPDGLDDEILENVQAQLGMRFHERSTVVAGGRVAAATALIAARELIQAGSTPVCLIAGVDSFLEAETLAFYEEHRRLSTSRNSNGFIPGEAAAAVLIGRVGSKPGIDLVCRGMGEGTEKATIYSEQPLRADGLVMSFKSALADAGTTLAELDYRITDANGEQYWFKEASLAFTRTLRVRKERFDIWHPADCIGETGAAFVPCAIAVALTAARKRYAPGPSVLCHFGSDQEARYALVLSGQDQRADS